MRNLLISPGYLLNVMLCSAVCLVLAHAVFVEVGAAGPQWARWFDLDGERNVPAVYSCFLLLMTAFLAAACFVAEYRLRRISGWNRLAWPFAFLLFLWLGIEEFVGIHEQVSSNSELVPMLDSMFGSVAFTVRDWFGRGYRYSWIVFYAPLIVASVAALWWFCGSRFGHDMELGRHARTATILYVLVIVFETASKPLRHNPEISAVLMVWEEFCEIVGTTLFLHVFYLHWLRMREGKAWAN